ncbi:double-strand break repair protein AddB [Arsenicitalea aurantiaca]|uniref:Double-strand break repair protein AddB n=1 Tax=Arsenicitalea aurantiaca TaxID=1783274 RepID=A0A433X8C1_9HYPH|nr:double-strand break repair protein AddB [Arsenicitalea aurantiaca]RUT30316.1 double-strand break repair protein AddB [Arsenicitalea aurantiaca]
MSRQSLFTIAPDAPFLPLLAQRILDGTLLSGWAQDDPFWLADVTIILPTRRARLALADALARAGHGLLPDIRTFGGEAEDEEPFLPPFDAPALPRQMPALTRRLELARLVAAWAHSPAGLSGFASPPNAAEILWLADSLSGLIDDFTTEAVDLARLGDIAPESLAANWQQTLRFLGIVLEAWPMHLAAHGAADAPALRNLRLARQAAAAPHLFGDRPVIAAGSTGSIPATADLLAAIARLPRGVVVLPGLDTGLSPEAHARLLDPARTNHGHPQYGLARLLRRFATTPEAVTELAPPGSGRRALIRAALAPAEETALWASTRPGPEALEAMSAGLAILAARTADEEARAVAIAAREGLEAGRTVGIVTPDRNLARRIAAELARFNVRVDDTAGTPLFQSPAGRLMRSLLALAANGCTAVDLMALLNNRAARLGLPRAELARRADLLERGLLRGQRLLPGLSGLRAALAASAEGRLERPALKLEPADREAIGDLLDRLDALIAPVIARIEAQGLTAPALSGVLHAAFAAAVEGLDPPLVGTHEIGLWADGLAGAGTPGPVIAPVALDAVLSALMAGVTVRPQRPGREDIAIWGTLEARLQNPDRLILAGLNEDVWPEPADPGPWLSRGMRLAAGLEPPERRQGLAAHDFEMALGNGETILAFAERLGSGPAMPSRLVQRLEAYLGEARADAVRARGAHWLDLARRLDHVAVPIPAMRPLPRPRADLRPRRLSITEVETLFRSPYDLYARHVLALRPLEPLGTDPGGRERGSLVHAVFARFVEEGHDPADPAALETLETMAREIFAGLEAIAARRDIWLRRFSVAAEAFLDFERARAPFVRSRHAEIAGRMAFPDLDGFTLTGRADRVDRLMDGRLEIIDFKTGTLPDPGAMVRLEAPQLPLEAAMARAGALGAPDEPGPGETAALTYIKIGLGPDAFTVTPFRTGEDQGVMDAADEALRRLQGHVSALLLADHLPMAARIRPDPRQRFRGDYDHLARTAEWTAIEGEAD